MTNEDYPPTLAEMLSGLMIVQELWAFEEEGIPPTRVLAYMRSDQINDLLKDAYLRQWPKLKELLDE